MPETAKRAVALLNQAGIPVLVTGGLAVIAHGYPRLTVDADLIVPDFQEAHQLLLHQGYHAEIHVPVGALDPQSKVRVDILPGGKSLTPRCPVNYPMPVEMGYHYVSLPDLISLKLGSYRSNPARRSQDRADVDQLIMRTSLPRDLSGINPAVQELYHQLWDAIQAEPPGPEA